MPTALVFLAEGAEEMETVISVDVLRRGGLEVTLASLDGDGPVECSRNMRLMPDKNLNQALSAGPYDVLVCPGGLKGAENLCKSAEVGKALKEQEQQGRVLAAVCAAPIALLAHGIATGKKLTSHPSVKGKLEALLMPRPIIETLRVSKMSLYELVDMLQKITGDYSYLEERVVVDGNLITSRGPGTCFEFALAIVESIQGKEKAQSLIDPMLVNI